MQSETSRIEAFSDGVFAIAITLLILEIRVPATSQTHLARLLLQQWPSYLAFLLSFAFIGIMWINHHRLFTHIRQADDVLLILNLLLMLGVTFVPFPTQVLASRLRGPDQRTAALFFNGTYVVIAVFFNVLWQHAVSHDLVPATARESANRISRQYAFGPVVYGICLLLAWFSVPVSLGLNVALAIFFVFPPSLLHRATTRK